MTEAQTIDAGMIEGLLGEARISARRRAIRRLHSGDWEHCHRMLNALVPGTYVQPHRHPDRHQGEGFIILKGRLALLIFDDDGSVDAGLSRVLSPEDGVLGIDIASGIWHSLVALEECVIYEVKGQPPGGYVQADDKEFAPWAPAEGEPSVDGYLRSLEQTARGLIR